MFQATAGAEMSEAAAGQRRRTTSRTPQTIRVLSDQEILSFDTDMHPYVLESIIIAGNPIGLIEALAQAAKKEHHDAYGFVTRHAYRFIFDMAYGDRRKTKGRHGSPLSRLRKDFAHAQRADLWESYRESQPRAEELKIQATDSRTLKEIKKKRGTNSLWANASDGVIGRFMSNGQSPISARTVKASRLIVKK